MRTKEVKSIIGTYLNKPVHNIFWMCTDQDGFDWYYVKDHFIQNIVKFDPYLCSVIEVLR